MTTSGAWAGGRLAAVVRGAGFGVVGTAEVLGAADGRRWCTRCTRRLVCEGDGAATTALLLVDGVGVGVGVGAGAAVLEQPAAAVTSTTRPPATARRRIGAGTTAAR
jgi:hypothetical protein